MRDFLVSGTMPFILVMSVYFLVRFVMYLLPSKSKGTFLFKAQWHFKKPWLIVPTVVLVVVYTGFGLWFSADKIVGQWIRTNLAVVSVVPADSLGGTDVFAGENLYKRCFGYHTFRYVA